MPALARENNQQRPTTTRVHRPRLAEGLHGSRDRGQPAGRLTFNLRPDLCPKTVANFLALCTGVNAGVDPKLTYAGCTFEPYSGKYTYVCKGNGKHVYGGVGKFVERTR